MRGSPEERFWAKVDKTDGCWLWTGSTRGGYGLFGAGKRVVSAHRFSWELVNGLIPPGMEIDHRLTCPKNCVRPNHLRAVPHKGNGENRDGPNRNSTSGLRGVGFDKRRSKWTARVTHYGRTISCGYFSTVEEADEAVVALRRKLFTHSDMDVAKRNTTPRKGEMK